MPLYYHLLNDKEIDRLKVVLRILRDNREALLDRWYELYRLHFGESRTFSEVEFKKVFGEDLDAITATLLEHDIVAMSRAVHRAGERLLDRGVPFDEVIASMHLFEESSAHFYRGKLSVALRGIDLPMIFDKLSHVRMILLTRAYFGKQQATQAARTQALESDLQRLDPAADQRTQFHGIVGASAPMRQLYARIQSAAATRASILVAGESGTGKELVARAIHECGDDPKAPFIAVNCAALPRELIESELFGHRKGAFSGAVEEYLGLVRAADQGTLFLDEITEMPVETQAKLLRVLQERRVRPVGGTKEVSVDVRFIASTNRDPARAVEERRIRKDLFYRLRVHLLQLPPLRERGDDIKLLAEHFIALFNQRYPRRVRGIDPEALHAMQRYDWPGNVRELMNAIESAFAYGRTDWIVPADLPSEITGMQAHTEHPSDDTGEPEPLPTFEESEKMLLERALQLTEGNKLRAARMLGISRKQLYAKIKKYEIDTSGA